MQSLEKSYLARGLRTLSRYPVLETVRGRGACEGGRERGQRQRLLGGPGATLLPRTHAQISTRSRDIIHDLAELLLEHMMKVWRS